ncbi:MAG: hypothetical protein JST98_11275 [Bacteroidetes bacterium]|nr:hypothetical protein [Bacteroidota bacterium]
MEMKVQVPFQQLLAMVRSLTPHQKAKLREELTRAKPVDAGKESFMEFLLNGPVLSKGELDRIRENRESIAAWRSKA